jgi:hypothetical protein
MTQVNPALDRSSPSDLDQRHPLLVAALLVAFFYAAAIPVILLHVGDTSRGAFDQNVFHLQVIRQFIAQWPRPDLSDYPSSTTPGFHLFVALVAQITGEREVTLRLVGSLFTAGLLFTLGFVVGKRMKWLQALMICLPLLCSVYVFSAGAFLLPDNAGWWGVLGMMLIALRSRIDRWTYLLGAAVLLATVLVRQIHLWTAAPLMAAVFLGSEEPQNSSQPEIGRGLRIAWMLLGVVPVLVLLWWFHRLWHDHLVPPNQITSTIGGNAAAPALILCVAGIVALFFGGYLAGSAIPGIKTDPESKAPRLIRLLVCGALVGGIIGAIPHTTYDISAGRYSGLWNAARHFPYVGQRSLLIIALAALGGMGVFWWLAAMPPRQRWIWASAAVAFVAALSAAGSAWQRYDEPFILMAAALSAPTFVSGQTPNVAQPSRAMRHAWIGPLVLGVLNVAVTVHAMR